MNRLIEKTREELLAEIRELKKQLSSHSRLQNGNGMSDADRYRALFENNVAGVFRTTAKGALLECNQSFLNIYGYGSIEEIGSTGAISFYFDPGERTAYLRELRKKNSLNNYILRQKKKDGTEIWTLANVRLYPDHRSGEEIIEGTLVDISDRKKTEERVLKSEARFRMLAENALDIVYRYSFFPENKYEYVSPSIYVLTGYSPEEFYADPYLGFKIIHPDDLHMTGESEQILKERSDVKSVINDQLVMRWIRKDGRIIWTETKSKPIFDDNGKIIAIEGISRDVTERKTAEQQLKDSEERFRLLAEATFEGLVFSEDGRIIDANNQFLKMYGYGSVDEVRGLRLIEDFILPEKQEEARKMIRLPKSEPWEVKTKKKDGSVITVESKGQTIPYLGKKIRATVIYDITQRKQYEKDLRESERALSTLMNNLPGMAYRCEYDDCWTMRFVSKGCLALTGYNPRDLVSNKRLRFSDIVHPDDRETGRIEIEEAIRTRTPFEIQYRILAADNSVKWVWEKGEGVFDENEKLLFLEGFITNITDRKEYELRLEQSRENYRRLVENSPDGIFIHDLTGKVVFVNPAALRMFGLYDIEELNDKTIFNFILPEYHLAVRERRKLLAEGEELPFMEVKAKRADGTIVELESKPIEVVYEGRPAIQVVCHDITLQRQFELEQIRLKVAEETNKKLEREVAQRRLTERRMRAAQKFIRLIIDSSIDMICASDKGGFVTEFNRAAQLTFGYTLDEVLGKHVNMFYAFPETREKIAEEIYAKGNYAGEVVHKRRNGELFYAFLSSSVLKNEEGETIGAMGISRDITEIRKTQEELRISEEHYRLIYNQAFVGIAKVSTEGKYLQVNQQLCNIFGYTAKELCSRSFPDITWKGEPDKSLELKDRVLAGEIENFTIEKKYVHKNGSTISANLSVSLVRSPEGKPDYFISVIQDITGMKRAEEQSILQAAKMNAIIENSTHLIWTIDRDRQLTAFNKNYADVLEDIYGVRPRAGTAINRGKMVSAHDYTGFWDRRYEEAFQGNAQYFDTRVEMSGEKQMWLEIYLNPILDSSGKVVEVSGIGHDITEKKQNEEKIKQSLREKEVLLKEVHHRVKNNLQVISSILNLQTSYVKDKKTLEALTESQNRIKSMAFIHENLYQTKDFSHIKFSEYIINLSKNLVHTYSNLDNRIELKLDVENIFLNLDLAIPCGLIINELVSNSLKYAFPRKKKGEIRIVLRWQEGKITLEIADNGIGIPPKIDFRNTDSLGLQLVVSLVDQLNGTINLNNNGGTCFSIIFDHAQQKQK